MVAAGFSPRLHRRDACATKKMQTPQSSHLNTLPLTSNWYKYIQNQLGHSSPTVTLNVYVHLMNSTNQEAACRLGNAVFGVVGHHLGTKNEERGYGVNRNPLNLLVGGTGLEPVTSTV